MPATKSQGYKGRIVIDNFEVSNLATSANFDVANADIDVTTFDSDGWEERLQTLKTATFKMNVIKKGDLASYRHLINAVVGDDDTTNDIAWMPSGSTVGSGAWIFSSYASSNNVNAPVKGAIGGDVDFMNKGQVYRAIVLHSSEGNTTFTGLL